MNLNRRSFFGLAFGALLAKFLPKPKISTATWNVCGGDLGRIDRLRNEIIYGTSHPEAYCPEITQAENVKFEGNVIRAIDPRKPHSVTISYVTRNGFVTTPSCPQKWTAVSQLPIGPPNVRHRIVRFN